MFNFKKWFSRKKKVESIVSELLKEPKNKVQPKGLEVTAENRPPFKVRDNNLERVRHRIMRLKIAVGNAKNPVKREEYSISLKRLTRGLLTYKQKNDINENIVDDNI